MPRLDLKRFDIAVSLFLGKQIDKQNVSAAVVPARFLSFPKINRNEQ